MVHKKKFLGGLKLLLLVLFIILLGSFSTCYASVSYEYIDYSINTLKDTLVSESSTFTNNHKKMLGLLSESNKNSILTYINNFLNTNNISALNDYNLIFSYDYSSNSIINLRLYFCNNSSPNGIENIDFYKITPNTSTLRSSNFTRYNGGTDKIYYIFIRIPANSNITSLSTITYQNGNIPANSSYWWINLQGYNFYTNSTILTAPNIVCCGVPLGYFNNSTAILQNSIGNYTPATPEPDEPSGDTPSNSGLGNITNSSGDNGGNINLQPIQEGLTNIQNQISGDTQKVIENQNQNTQTIINALSGEIEKITNTLTDSADDLIDNTIITSGDIESALNFEIAEDPYSNFWFTLTNNLKSALLGSKRSIDISFQGRTWTISLDEYMVLPAWLIIILTPFSTAFFTWVLVRQFKLIFDKLASGNVDSLLKENSEERHF